MSDKDCVEVPALLPCPFCGDTDQGMCVSDNDFPAIQCNNCGAYGPCIKANNEGARAEWNTRAPAHPLIPSELRNMEKDAERYRMLKAMADDEENMPFFDNIMDAPTEEWDAKLDAARRHERRPDGAVEYHARKHVRVRWK